MTGRNTLQRSPAVALDESAFCRKVVVVVLVCFSVSLGLIARPAWSSDLIGAITQRWCSYRDGAQKAYQTASSEFDTSGHQQSSESMTAALRR